jgi:sialate O-acetylesterase
MLRKTILCALAFFAGVEWANADLKLATLFRDGLVLQRGKPVSVWGTANPGEEVKVQFKDQTKVGKAGSSGHWSVKLDALSASAEPATLRVTGKDSTVTLNKVVVGEVWLCSGQSNMNMPLSQAMDAEREIANASYPLIQYFEVNGAVADQRMETAGGEWTPCLPKNAARFTAAGYFFARELQRELGVPIGIIKSTLGGSPIEGWMSREALASDPAFAVVHERWNQIAAGIRKRSLEYEQQLAAWNQRKRVAESSGQAFTEPKPVRGPEKSDRNKPSGLYNGLIAPLEPFTLAGFLWYQGEGNAPRAGEYARLFSTMIRQWRRDFQQNDLPFLFVQLPLFAPANDESGQQWAWLREAQASALTLPNTGMAVAIDLGETNNIHPLNKQEVGRRLALVALRKVYGRNVEDSGPAFAGIKREGAALRIQFENAAGLRGTAAAMKSFELAGADKKFLPAEARIDGQSVVVSANGMLAPVAVRYAWTNVPEGFLFNSRDLPAAPFRSDHW